MVYSAPATLDGETEAEAEPEAEIDVDAERKQGMTQNRTHELAPAVRIIVCTTCESYWGVEPATSNITLGAFCDQPQR